MRPLSIIPLLVLFSIQPVAAIPNSVFGQIVEADSSLNGEDLDDLLLGDGLWDGRDELPGDWVAQGSVGDAQLAHLLARPKLFGREVLMLRSTERDGKLAQLEATFVDAGSHFGYFDEKLPEGLSRRQLEEVLNERLATRQADFALQYDEVLAELREAISKVADQRKAKSRRFGHVRMLRAEPEEWIKDELSIRLFVGDQRLVRVVLSRKGEEAEGWLDPKIEEMSERGRLTRLAESVQREDGRVLIGGVEIVPQGYKPYCGLNTLAMAARHFGLHVDEDWMAAAAGFKNTGSAGGSNMVKLYHAVAAEAGLSMDRSPDFDETQVKRAIDRGMPVVVWRRFSHERNRLHERTARDEDFELPDPSSMEERASWPGEEAPLHASVITGYDADTGELFLLESWSVRGAPRRMKIEEMAATTYLCFAFQP